ncbi:MAG: rhomboid family intramembrane serine protease [Bacteroidetes bacterium]|nr:rhomboid family intramembrane serine protease [Bacteroidota bacterium]MCB9225627.1 rhomboid family intramembrane serine protease [Chitinophagales bacterium]
MYSSINRTETVKHIIIANVIFFVLFCTDFSPLYKMFPVLSLWYFDSPFFRPWQYITHFFMHGSFMHIFFNMYALYLFGTILEQVWGAKRFIFFYFTTGIIASILYSLVAAIEYQITYGTMFPYSEGITSNIYVPMVGASGAIFGLLTAFGMLFPNTELRLLFPPIALKAKYFVLIYIALELWLGFQQFSGDNVAHFAHITGALVGFLLVKYWQKNSKTFY